MVYHGILVGAETDQTLAVLRVGDELGDAPQVLVARVARVHPVDDLLFAILADDIVQAEQEMEGAVGPTVVGVALDHLLVADGCRDCPSALCHGGSFL